MACENILGGMVKWLSCEGNMMQVLRQRLPWRLSKERRPLDSFPVSLRFIPIRSGSGENISLNIFPSFSQIAARELRLIMRSWNLSSIGRLASSRWNLNGLKKIPDAALREKRELIEPVQNMISISRQCELLDINRSSYYYCPKDESSYNLILMNLIDEQYTLRPFYGVPRMTAWLRREGHLVNPKRVRRLMRLMGLEAIYPKPRLSQSCPGHKRYSYLLKGLVIDHSDQVWCSDITYIRLLHGFVYLTVVMDWFSRYVLSWELSITLDKEFCLKALEKALSLSKPEIFKY